MISVNFVKKAKQKFLPQPAYLNVAFVKTFEFVKHALNSRTLRSMNIPSMKTFNVRCTQCTKLVPYKRGHFWECNNFFTHQNHFMCRECIELDPKSAVEGKCKFVMEKKRQRRCDLCKVIIMPHLLPFSQTCRECFSDSDSFDVCPDCLYLVKHSRRELSKARRNISAYDSTAGRPVKFAQQPNKKQLQQIKSRKRLCKQRYLRAKKVQTCIYRYRNHANSGEDHNSWRPIVEDVCVICDDMCNRENYYCIDCKSIHCPNCHQAADDIHLEHQVLHYRNGYLASVYNQLFSKS